MLHNPITEQQIPKTIARDEEIEETMRGHVAATDPHLQYPTQERGDARYVRKYGQYFRAAPSVSQSLAQNVVTKINFDTIVSNVGKQYSSANNRLIALENETWRITTNIKYSLPTSSRFLLFLAKNGGTSLRELCDFTCPSGFFSMNITPADTNLVTGEYLELWARITNIASGSIYGDNTLNTCWWEGSRVG